MIKLISTEDKIEITSPKEIVLTAGGSQLKINGDGIFTTTGGKFESKAGQHSFVGGAKYANYQMLSGLVTKTEVLGVDYSGWV